MAGETTITLVGNLTADPDIRHLDNGDQVANFNIASTPRHYAREAGEWRDGEPLFMRCAAWRDLADHVAATLSRGMRVIATGRLRQRTFETGDGERRTVIDLEVDEIGPSLRWATAQVTKTTNGGRGRQRPAAAPNPSTGGFGAPPTDQWATGAVGADKPPF
ncbi:single-strand DNA-binding protein [Murinocardiopsis flavida]|uniref:Single-stranded DNA-binding protein n=1 Tax=Murinocardiopsis flavida TaxID=645275 RepID=A0A2P8DFR1_9ACTN|nr:single-stranded DNA-binding protein [Murinocardiopsis flavida]PSK96050.1 single-strand DNA-binding protein [Murinocardiopsis flavida]